jgi:divalent metal cation (Fe/Co/Zn/Cd) transporter
MGTLMDTEIGHPPKPRTSALWLQIATLAWMVVEVAIAGYAAATAHSPALMAFGSDSFVELLSAAVVLVQWTPRFKIAEKTAGRVAGGLLFALGFVVAAVAIASIVLRWQPEVSCSGIGITIAALVVMPVLATLKRLEARRSGNVALAADAVQSATCAYLALITLAGLAANAVLHLPWLDSAAALLILPFLIREGRSAWRGHACGCC